jgi:hypothetical protein
MRLSLSLALLLLVVVLPTIVSAQGSIVDQLLWIARGNYDLRALTGDSYCTSDGCTASNNRSSSYAYLKYADAVCLHEYERLAWECYMLLTSLCAFLDVYCEH